MSDDGLLPIADGHRIHFTWERDSIRVMRVECPSSDLEQIAICNRRRGYCVVERFVAYYGFEINTGVAPINGPVEVAWIGVEGQSDVDPEYASLWLIPVEDPEYREFFGIDSPPSD